jgi:undecaprenyl-diphosphatase
VSSTGHLILLVDLLGFQGPPGKVFEIVVQMGAILAVCLLYFRKLLSVLIGLPSDPGARRFAVAVVAAFLPAALIGVVLHGFIKAVLFSPWVVSVSLIVGGVVILVVEAYLARRPTLARVHSVDDFSPWLALWIGCAQVLAMIPGVSRSGATIISALLMGVDRKSAAEFSFFLAIPTMLGATVYDVYKNRGTLDGTGGGVIAVGFGVAFLSALLVVRALVAFVQRHGFGAFGWYRIAIGTVMLAFLIGSGR